jgi:DNA-binding NarL/FixJ family response regulator
VSQPAGRILIVDDFEPWRCTLRSMLDSKAGFHIVGEAAGGLDAVVKAQELEANLILLDIGLPDLNGIEAGRRIRSSMPEAMVIFVTANSNEEIVRAALNIGAAGYVLKSDAGRELLNAVTVVLGGGRFVSARAMRYDDAGRGSS